MLSGLMMMVYTCVALSSSTEGGLLRCFSSMAPVFGDLCLKMTCTYSHSHDNHMRPRHGCTALSTPSRLLAEKRPALHEVDNL